MKNKIIVLICLTQTMGTFAAFKPALLRRCPHFTEAYVREVAELQRANDRNLNALKLEATDSFQVALSWALLVFKPTLKYILPWYVGSAVGRYVTQEDEKIATIHNVLKRSEELSTACLATCSAVACAPVIYVAARTRFRRFKIYHDFHARLNHAGSKHTNND
jgi:hypothetical protein